MRTRTLLFIFLCTAHIASACTSSEMTKVRNLFHAARTESKLNTFLAYVKNVNCRDAKPYRAAAIMQQAEYAFSPISKLKYFNKGKAQLEAFINQNPSHIEARYVRLMVQKHVPSLLGYSANITEDKKFIVAHLSKSTLSSSYQKTILKYINV